MNTVEAIDLYCQAWSHPDPVARANMLASVWATGATYSDPTVYGMPADRLLAHIERVQATRPGARVIRSSKVDMHHRFARFRFKVIGADGLVLREGLDIVTLSPDGLTIESVLGFFGDLAERDDA
jgi:hypothetical protein